MGKQKEKSKVAAPKRAMILAAGLGIRMRPLTNEKPKAMVEILGRPLIAHTLDLLAPLGLEKIVVNLHHKPEPLIAWLDRHPLRDILVFSDETDQILDTGGAVKKALDAFRGTPFYAVNCDAFFEPGAANPCQALAEAYTGEGALLLLAQREKATGYKGRGDFLVSRDGRLDRPTPGEPAPTVFTGLQILHPDLFKAADQRVFSLNRIFDRAQKKGQLSGIMTPAPWYHIGTPETLREVEAKVKGGPGR